METIFITVNDRKCQQLAILSFIQKKYIKKHKGQHTILPNIVLFTIEYSRYFVLYCNGCFRSNSPVPPLTTLPATKHADGEHNLSQEPSMVACLRNL